MMFETLPNWVWLFYYLFIIATLAAALYNAMRKRKRALSVFTAIVTLITPFLSFLFALGRRDGLNEWEYIGIGFQEGSIWALTVTAVHLMIVAWWFFFFVKDLILD
ncbi:hypothetical protein ABER68_10910 [Paenibacillus alvei]|uniref:hypothetical protein n=1 Tax=Niallia sp. FSL R7-0271 TaxID=2921678 RepID=UPI0030FD10C0